MPKKRKEKRIIPKADRVRWHTVHDIYPDVCCTPHCDNRATVECNVCDLTFCRKHGKQHEKETKL